MPFGGYLGTPDFGIDNTSLPDTNGVPFDAMGEMMGIQIPQVPQRDPYGRYGITEGQSRDAGNAGMAQALFGAAQSFFGGGAAPSLQGGMNAGTVNRGMLDKASASNAADYNLQLQNTLARLGALESKSNIELQQINIKQQRDKLQEMEKQREISSAFATAMHPVADKYIGIAMANSPDVGGPEVKNSFFLIESYLNAGEIEKAQATLDKVTRHPALGGISQEAIDEDIKKATINGLAKHKVDKLVWDSVLAQPGFEGYKMGIGADGQITALDPFEIQRRQLLLTEARSRITENEAQAAASVARANATLGLDPKQIHTTVRAVDQAIQILQIPEPVDQGDLNSWREKQAKAAGTLMNINMDPSNKAMIDSWSRMTIAQKLSAVRQNAQSQYNSLYGMQAPAGAPYQFDASPYAGTGAGGGQAAPKTRGFVAGALANATRGFEGNGEDVQGEARRRIASFTMYNEPTLQSLLGLGLRGDTPLEQLNNLKLDYLNKTGIKPLRK